MLSWRDDRTESGRFWLTILSCGTHVFSNQPTLACDIDSTIWDLTAWVCEAVLDVTGEEAAMEVYTRALSPHRVREREPYPGSVEVLRRLQEERGMGVHFVTHNWDP